MSRNLLYILIIGTLSDAELITPGAEEGFLVPIRKIPGTKLYSGLFYEIGMKSFPDGFVTYTDHKVGDDHYLQIDNNPDNLPFYVHGCKWERDVHWGFEPGPQGYYFMRNLAVPNSTVLIRQEDDYSHLVLATLPPSDLTLNNGLVKLVPTKDEDSYQLKFQIDPEGSVTWTIKKHGDYSHFLQLSNRTDHKFSYQEDQEWYNDTLFTFRKGADQGGEPHLDLEATVLNFQINLTNASNLELSLEQDHSHNYPSSTDADGTKTTTPVPISFKIDQDIVKWWDNLQVSFTIASSDGSGDVEIYFKVDNAFLKKQAGCSCNLNPVNGTITKVKPSLVPTTHGIKIDLLGSKDNMELPFKSWVQVKGQADRMLINGTGFSKGVVPGSLVRDRIILEGARLGGNDGMKLVGEDFYLLLTGTVSGPFVVILEEDTNNHVVMTIGLFLLGLGVMAGLVGLTVVGGLFYRKRWGNNITTQTEDPVSVIYGRL